MQLSAGPLARARAEPSSVMAELARATSADVLRWSERLLSAQTLESIFQPER